VVADPDVVELGLLVVDEMDWQPYPDGVHVGCPIPRVLVAGLARVRIVEGHAVTLLPLRVNRLRTPQLHHQQVVAQLHMRLDIVLIFEEGVDSVAQFDVVDVDGGVGVDALEAQGDVGVVKDVLADGDGLDEFGRTVGDGGQGPQVLAEVRVRDLVVLLQVQVQGRRHAHLELLPDQAAGLVAA